jgi:glycine cleavage system H protein
MSDVRDDRRYTETHEWVEMLADGTARVGITEHAQEAMGELVYVDLPEAGRAVKRGESLAVVESVKAASDLYAPFDGEIVETNGRLTASPELVNSAPYGDGWVVRLRPARKDDVEQLLDAAAYRRTLER